MLYHEYHPVTGKRIYNSATEESRHCHQCRQKTIGKRTHCSKCANPMHIMCGDCLWMRYGENLDEAAKNPVRAPRATAA